MIFPIKLSTYILCFFILETQTQQTSLTYTVAVVDYYPISDRNIPPEIRISRNVGAYENIISDLSERVNLDLIVFPEATLTTNSVIASHADMYEYSVVVPDPSDQISPCYGSGEFPAYFSMLSCNALYFKTYITVNLFERARCISDSCAEDNWDYYNTNVIFDRNGTIVGRYRKFHLFGEYLLNRTTTPDISIIETDFGLKFGVFTCFDILFRKPGLDVVREHGIKHFIYPSMWFSELPFLTALQAQQQWAEELDVVLLASGANNPSLGSGGSGIFQGKSGSVTSGITATATTKVYTVQLSQNETHKAETIIKNEDVDRLAKEMDSFYLLKDDLRLYTSQLINLENPQGTTTLCSGDDKNRLCCHFSISTIVNSTIYNDKTKQHYYYRMVAYSGVRIFSGVATGGVEVCAIVACTESDNQESCGGRFKDYSNVSWPVTFSEIEIKANFSLEDNRIQFPNSLLSSIRPLSQGFTEWSHKTFEDGTIIERTHVLKKAQDRLMTFGIYGRDFNRDGDPLPEVDPPGKDLESGTNSLLTRPGFLFIILLSILVTNLN